MARHGIYSTQSHHFSEASATDKVGELKEVAIMDAWREVSGFVRTVEALVLKAILEASCQGRAVGEEHMASCPAQAQVPEHRREPMCARLHGLPGC